jgi:hypothetical protein
MYKFLIGDPEGRKRFGVICRWEDNNDMDDRGLESSGLG